MNRTLLYLLAAGAAILAAALHSPGHISMDTSLQLKEALMGQSSTWNPPFMSALLQLFGNGEPATAAFVALCVALTYGSYALVLSGEPQPAQRSVTPWRHALRTTAGAVLIANPVVFIYVGIVWKDVLFASLLCFAFASALAASRQPRLLWALMLVSVSLACLVLAAHTRQQGLYLLPILVLAPLVAMRKLAAQVGVSTSKLFAATGLVVLLGYAMIGRWTEARIHPGEKGDVNVGLSVIMDYDILGILRHVGPDLSDVGADLPAGFTAAAVTKAYSPQRIDQISTVPDLRDALLSMDMSQRFAVWRGLVVHHPLAYLAHRAQVASWLLGMHSIAYCLPVHVGVEGDAAALEALHIPMMHDSRDNMVFALSVPLRDTLWMRHYATLAMLALAIAGSWWRRREVSGQIALVFLGGMAVFTVSMLFLTIACDFRYLYPVIPVVTACLLSLLALRTVAADATVSLNGQVG